VDGTVLIEVPLSRDIESETGPFVSVIFVPEFCVGRQQSDFSKTVSSFLPDGLRVQARHGKEL
jgi:hypothetical protein